MKYIWCWLVPETFGQQCWAVLSGTQPPLPPNPIPQHTWHGIHTINTIAVRMEMKQHIIIPNNKFFGTENWERNQHHLRLLVVNWYSWSCKSNVLSLPNPLTSLSALMIQLWKLQIANLGEEDQGITPPGRERDGGGNNDSLGIENLSRHAAFYQICQQLCPGTFWFLLCSLLSRL